MPTRRRRASARSHAAPAAARPVLYAGAMTLYDDLWEPLAITLLGLVLLIASL